MNEKPIYLTFDDGPNPPHTQQVLDILAQYGAKATFFVCGQNAEKYPELIRRIVAEGHVLGNHAYTHSMRLCFSPSLYQEFIKNNQLLGKISGVEIKAVRAPWGLLLPSVRQQLQNHGQKVYHWDIAAYDWWSPSPQYIAEKIIRKARARSQSGLSSIVLLHDGNQTAGGNRGNTVQALPKILQTLGAEGFYFKGLV